MISRLSAFSFVGSSGRFTSGPFIGSFWPIGSGSAGASGIGCSEAWTGAYGATLLSKGCSLNMSSIAS